MPWSKQQEKAIYTKGQNILVAAAAGSGKTSVLVERIIQHLVGGYCNINEILVVTFTKAAASEMQGRIAKAISQQLDAHQREKQLILLNGASISTLHSFCQAILRQYFYNLDLDPRFRLANQQEINLLKYDVLEQMFEDFYTAEDNEDFNQLINIYGSERGDEGLYQLILRLFEFAQAQPFPEKWLRSLPMDYLVENITETKWYKLFRQHFQVGINNLQAKVGANYKYAEALGSDKYLKLFGEELIIADQLKASLDDNWDEFVELINNLTLPRFSADKNVSKEATEQVKIMRGEAWDGVKEWKKEFALQTIGEMEEDLPLIHRQAKALVEMTIAFAQAFAQGKRDKNIIDFSDLEHFALQILTSDKSTADNLIPSPIALELQAKFKEVMVDEYQDTNGVQEAILNLVAGGDPKKFYVGDVKQSIYKFRLAEPELFLAKYKTYPSLENCLRIDLAQNFRSRSTVLAATNCIFSQLMRENIMELSYGEAEALKYGLKYPEGDNILNTPVELHLIGEDMPYIYNDGTETKELIGYDGEICFIGDKIKDMMAAKTKVYDKDLGKYRPIAYRDIVILLRSVVGKAKDLAEELQKRGIPVYANLDDGYFKAVEVDLILSLLQIIDNPQQDIPLTGVLFSVIGKFSQEELGRIKVEAKGANMFNSLVQLSQEKSLLGEKCQGFLNQLEQWRIYSSFHSVPQLLWRLYEDTGYYEYLGGLPEGAVRQANLRALYTRAKDFEATSYRGLFRFLRYVHRLQDLDNDLSVARTLGEGEDVVRIMTIHKSKGLEFPVVFLPNLNKQFNLKDSREKILIHKDLGLGMGLQGEEVVFATMPQQSISLAMEQEAKAEEARVLYVAMTRAREKLIMSGSKIKNSYVAKLVRGAYEAEDLLLKPETIANANSYLDWIIPGVARHPDGAKLGIITEVLQEKLYAVEDDSTWDIKWGITGTGEKNIIGEDGGDFWTKVKNLQPVQEDVHLNWVDQRLNWRYPKLSNTPIPAKLTVTEVKQARETLEEDYSFKVEEFAKPKFMEAYQDITGMEYGTMVHRILQHLDLNGDLSITGLKEQIADFQSRQILPAKLEFIPYKKLAAFFTSKLGRALLKAKTVEREMHFNKLLPASLFYENSGEAPEIFLQGVIDLLYEEEDGWVLVDYKTDNIDEGEALRRYALQLQLYTMVAQGILAKPIKASYLYMIPTGEFYLVPKSEAVNLDLSPLYKGN